MATPRNVKQRAPSPCGRGGPVVPPQFAVWDHGLVEPITEATGEDWHTIKRGSSRTQEGLRGERGDRPSTTGGSLNSRRHIPATRLRRQVGREDSMFGEGRREKGEGRREKGEGRREK